MAAFLGSQEAFCAVINSHVYVKFYRDSTYNNTSDFNLIVRKLTAFQREAIKSIFISLFERKSHIIYSLTKVYKT